MAAREQGHVCAGVTSWRQYPGGSRERRRGKKHSGPWPSPSPHRGQAQAGPSILAPLMPHTHVHL